MSRLVPSLAIAWALHSAFAPQPLAAAPFDPMLVSADAKFVAFVDVDAGRKTALGNWMLERLLDQPGYQEFEKIMLDAAGFMPASDISDITIYGEKYGVEPEATLVIRASFDRERLANALTFAKGFTTSTYNGHELMSWIDEEKGNRIHACIADEKTILMTGSESRLKSSVDVVDDASRGMKPEAPLLQQKHDNAWAFAAGAELGSAPEVMKNELLAGVLDQGVAQLSETEGKSTLELVIETETLEQAQQALNAANGLKAILQMAGNRQRVAVPERAKLVADLASRTTAELKDKNVSVALTLENERAIDVVERLEALKESGER